MFNGSHSPNQHRYPRLPAWADHRKQPRDTRKHNFRFAVEALINGFSYDGLTPIKRPGHDLTFPLGTIAARFAVPLGIDCRAIFAMEARRQEAEDSLDLAGRNIAHRPLDADETDEIDHDD
jgi:hypothetical protein